MSSLAPGCATPPPSKGTSRDAGTIHHIPRGLLARAALYRVTADPDAATRDLAEAFEIADRGGMRLHLTDAHLERARLRVSPKPKQIPPICREPAPKRSSGLPVEPRER